MYKGQQVLVMNYARSDKWFWIPLDRDDYAKPFEHIKLRCADQAVVHKLDDSTDEQDEREKALHDDNTYFLEIDTKYYNFI